MGAGSADRAAVYSSWPLSAQRTKARRGGAVEVPLFETLVELVLRDRLGGETFGPPGEGRIRFAGRPGEGRIRFPGRTGEGGSGSLGLRAPCPG